MAGASSPQRRLGQADFGAGPLRQPGERAVRHVLEVVGVQLQDGRRPGQRFRDAGAELFLQQGQHFHPGPRPGEGGIGVAGIVPRIQSLDRADLQGVGPPQAQEGPQQAPADGPHPGQRAGAGAAGEAQQDLLGLVVQGVAEQDHAGARLSAAAASSAACRASRAAASGPMPGGRDVHGPDLHREPAPAPAGRRRWRRRPRRSRAAAGGPRPRRPPATGWPSTCPRRAK